MILVLGRFDPTTSSAAHTTQIVVPLCQPQVFAQDGFCLTYKTPQKSKTLRLPQFSRCIMLLLDAIPYRDDSYRIAAANCDTIWHMSIDVAKPWICWCTLAKKVDINGNDILRQIQLQTVALLQAQVEPSSTKSNNGIGLCEFPHVQWVTERNNGVGNSIYYYYYRSANPKPSGHRAYTQRVCSHTMGPLTLSAAQYNRTNIYYK